jgi:hypothetical protein
MYRIIKPVVVCLLLIIASALFVYAARHGVFFVVVLTLLVPLIMHFAGHYRFLYRWMAYIPLTITVPWLLSLESEIWQSKPLCWFVIAIIGVSIASGGPARTLVAILGWAERSTAPLEQAAAAVVHSDDVVVCTVKAWFAVRPHAKLVYCYGLPAQVSSVRRLICQPTVSVCSVYIRPADPWLEKMSPVNETSSLSPEPPAAIARRFTAIIRCPVLRIRRRHVIQPISTGGFLSERPGHTHVCVFTTSPRYAFPV